MMLTLIGGLLWATVYQRVPNLFALGYRMRWHLLVVTLSLSPSLVNGFARGTQVLSLTLGAAARASLDAKNLLGFG